MIDLLVGDGARLALECHADQARLERVQALVVRDSRAERPTSGDGIVWESPYSRFRRHGGVD